MPKRKRDPDGEEEWVNENPSLKRQTASLRNTIERSTKALASALKLARGFERQKLGRRQKQASSEPQSLLRLREEVIVLKQLDLNKTASIYLSKHLAKAKRVRESLAFVTLYGSEPQLETMKPGAEANVVGRLVNSAPVKQEMRQIMQGIYILLDLADGKPPGKTLPTDTKPESRGKGVEVQDDTPFEGFSVSGSSDEVEADDLPRSDVEDALVAAYQHRLAGSEDEDEEGDDQPSSSSHESISRSPSHSPQPDVKRKATTSFLPNLSLSGYYSGSDSGDDDAPGAAKPRKNRRGQRARQQIAEMKYGKSARHLQNGDTKDLRNTDWDAQRGAVQNHSDPRKRGYNGNRGALKPVSVSGKAYTAAINGTREKQKPSARDDAGPLHPSWEAAKQRKNQPWEQSTFTGKKITFE